jgi:hypothetical protein
MNKQVPGQDASRATDEEHGQSGTSATRADGRGAERPGGEQDQGSAEAPPDRGEGKVAPRTPGQAEGERG